MTGKGCSVTLRGTMAADTAPSGTAPPGARPQVRLLQSLQPLALLALREAGADGYAVCDLDPATGRRTLQFSCGAPLPDSRSDSKTGPLSVAEFPLRVEDAVTGILSFVFRGEAISQEARSLLARVAGQIEAGWRFAAAIRSTRSPLEMTFLRSSKRARRQRLSSRLRWDCRFQRHTLLPVRSSASARCSG